jgi:hypothetical protein
VSTPFEVARGSYQQRIAASHDGDGAFVYELGHAGHLDVSLEVGDRHDISQDFVVSSQAALVRLRVRIAAADDASSWTFSVWLNGDVHYQRTLAIAERELELNDVAVRLADADAAPTLNTITIRLELAA